MVVDPASRRRPSDIWWAPRRRLWWIAVLFSVGSLCFLVGPLPFYLDAVGERVDALTFFVGSLFFTTAAVLQWLETRHTGRRIDRWSSGAQLVGTLFFNATTFRALTTAIDSPTYDRVVWRPDAFGSICFLISGFLAYAAVTGRLRARPPRTMEGAVVSVNLFGCVAFGLSAVGAYVVPTTGSLLDVTLANAGTAVGAAAFLVGAVLLLPEGAAAPS